MDLKNKLNNKDDLSEIRYEASLEKVFSAEKNIAYVRTLVIIFNTLIYLLLMNGKDNTIPWLAYTIIGVANSYGLYILLFQPYKKYSVFLTSYYTYLTDALLITLWLIATGSFTSPFYVLWYISIIAVAFRYSSRVTILTALFYSLCYLGLILLKDGTFLNITELIIRIGYIFLIALLSTLITKETLQQTHEKILLQKLFQHSKEVEDLLKVQTTLYENLLNAQSEMGEGVAITEGQKFIYTNSALCRIYGYTEKELLAMSSFMDIVVSEERNTLTKRLRDRLSNNNTSSDYGELTVNHKDGHRINIAYSVKKIIIDDKVQLFSIIRDVTEQKNAERKLKESEELYRTVINSLSEGLIITDTEDKILFANPQMKNLLGYAPEELVGNIAYKLLLPEEKWDNMKNNIKKREVGISDRYEEEIYHKNKSKIWVEINAAPYKDSSGKVIGTVGVVYDITKQRKSVETIRLYGEIVKNLPVGLFVYHFEDINNVYSIKIIAANPAVEKLTGNKPEFFIGKNLYEISPNTYKTDRPLIYQQVAKSGRAEYVGIIHYTGSGIQDGYYSITTFALPDNSVGVAAENVTDRLKAQEDLLRLAAIVESSNDAIIGKTLDGIITSWNKGAEKTYGYIPNEIIGKPISLLCLPDQKEELENIIEKVKKGEYIDNHETTRLRKDGKKIHVSLTISPIRDSQGTINGAAIIARDITEQKKYKEALAQRASELIKINEELEKFAYVASHDLQEPLRSVSSYVQLLQKRYKEKLDKDANEFINYAVEGAKRMYTLINDLLTYSRIGSNHNALKKVNFQNVISIVIKNLEKLIHENKARINIISEMPVIAANEFQMVELFQNLISNAIKFKKSNIPVIIEIFAKHKKDAWLFSVKDNGIGIAEEYSERIFGIFQRLHGRDTYPGTGIGLAICKKIVEQHGGQIWVESKLGEGSVFYFTLRAAADQPQNLINKINYET